MRPWERAGSRCTRKVLGLGKGPRGSHSNTQREPGVRGRACTGAGDPGKGATLTFPPEAEAPLSGRDPAVLVGVAGVEEGADADLILVQVDSGQLHLVQEKVSTGVQLGEHPADGVLAAGP